jgi:hypothetical protein
MVQRTHKDDLTIREIEYSIQMKDKDKGFHDLLDVLRSEITRFEDTRRKREKLQNPISEFLKTNIERSIVIRGNTKVYFLDYLEQGSFSIQFKLLVITRYVNYGSVRQAIDFLIKDTVCDYFEELLERHFPVNVSVHSADAEVYEIPGLMEEPVYPKTRTFRESLTLILASLALLLSLVFGIVWIFTINKTTESVKPSDDYRDKYYELLINREINEAFQKEKLKILFNRDLVPVPDSARIQSQK